MKTPLALLLSLALILLPTQNSHAEDPPQNGAILGCVVAVLVITVGTVVIIGIKKLCDKLPPIEPPPPVITNTVPTNLPPHIKTNLPRTSLLLALPGQDRGPLVFESATLIAGDQQTANADNGWAEDFRFEFTIMGAELSTVLYDGNTPVATNRSAIFVGDGENYSLATFTVQRTNPPSQFWRLLSQP